jgi:YD repeat-containing protein
MSKERLDARLCLFVIVLFSLGWNTDAAAQAPPLHPGEDGTTRVVTYSEYDSYGRVTKQENAYGHEIEKLYSGPHLIQASTVLGNTVLAVDYSYDDYGRLESITDKNGNAASFEYDGFGRLKYAFNADADTVSVYDYHYSQTDPTVDPSYVLTRSVGGNSPDVVAQAYVDGLGREWQSHQHVEGGRIVSATQYDSLGRPYRKYRPFVQVADGFQAGAEAGQNYTETRYEANPLNRPSKVIYPDGNYQSKEYGVSSAPASCSELSGMYSFTRGIDERGDEVETYTDGFGQTVATVADPNGLAATTCFEYDAAGNLVRVQKPERDEVTYSYDTRGQLVERISPDAGTTRMKYDASGNLRFSQDARQESGGMVNYTIYDSLGRPTHTGVVGADFASLDPGTAYTRGNSSYRTVTVYDGMPAESRYPWVEVYLPSIDDSTANLKGRVAAQATRSDGQQPWRMVFFTYDEEGRVSSKHIRMNAAPDHNTDIEYAYDRQGRMTRRVVTVGDGASAERVAYWYTYNERGLADALYARTRPGTDPSRPDRPDLRMSYAADRQVDTLHFQGMEPIAYQHNNRGFVTDIGAGSSYFTTSYQYYADGNIDRMNVDQPASPSSTSSFTYDFTYDKLDRLRGADYVTTVDNRFDVYVEYSANGNITQLQRHDEGGSLVDDLTYDYSQSGSNNRLDHVTDVGAGTTSWDARGGGFTYDEVGNMVSSPAPYNLESATYNHNNLPTSISVAGASYQYHYTAGGQRFITMKPSGDKVVTILDGSVVLGRFEPNSFHWNLVLPSGEVVGRIIP